MSHIWVELGAEDSPAYSAQFSLSPCKYTCFRYFIIDSIVELMQKVLALFIN